MPAIILCLLSAGLIADVALIVASTLKANRNVDFLSKFPPNRQPDAIGDLVTLLKQKPLPAVKTGGITVIVASIVIGAFSFVYGVYASLFAFVFEVIKTSYGTDGKGADILWSVINAAPGLLLWLLLFETGLALLLVHRNVYHKRLYERMRLAEAENANA